MNYLTHALREHQELAVVLTLAIVFFIGRRRIGTFSLGTAVGTLLSGVAIGKLTIPVAYAVTYLIGTAFIVWFLPNVGPKLMRVNLKEEARKLRAKIAASDAGEPETPSAYQALAVRAYQVTNPNLINRSVAELEARPK